MVPYPLRTSTHPQEIGINTYKKKNQCLLSLARGSERKLACLQVHVSTHASARARFNPTL